MPDVSIVIPAFVRTVEQAIWLHEALLSTDAQTFNRYEVIVVNDGSPIDISEIVERWPDVRWLTLDENQGPGAARNVGVGAAKGEYILFLDADDKLRPTGLQMLYEKRCENGYTYGNLEYIGDKTGIHVLEDFTMARLMQLNGPNPITSLFPRKAWRAVGGFDETLEGLEDIEFWIRLAAAGYCGQHIHGTTFEYRVHGSSRQADLQANNLEKLHRIAPRIRVKHQETFGRLNMGNCKNCPGGTPAGTPTIVSPRADGLPENSPSLIYTGGKIGSFFITSPSQKRYMVNGRGTEFAVHPNDVEWFLSFRVGDTYQLKLPPPPPLPTKPNPPKITAPMPLPDLPDITTLTANEALKLVATTSDSLDLKVWLAEEKGNQPPRQTVIKALESKLKVKVPA